MRLRPKRWFYGYQHRLIFKGNQRMSTSTYYMQSCPTCGRRLRVLVEYMGRRLTCPHCRALFHAGEPAMEGSLDAARIERLIAQSPTESLTDSTFA